MIFWAFSLIIAVFIFVMSAQNSKSSSGMSGNVIRFIVDLVKGNLNETNKLDLVKNWQFFVRKAAHWSIYFALGLFTVLAMLTYEISPWKRPAIAAGICLLYAVSDEVHQLFVPGRGGQIRDVLIDFFGAVTAIIIVLLIRKKRSVG